MTVKLVKFFNSGANTTPPPLPAPPQNTMMNNAAHHQHHPHQQPQYYHYQQEHQQKQQQQQQQKMLPTLPHYNPYYDVDDDDNMSMYSTTASIMTTRDHPFNNSQRPLLPARKPTTQLLHKKKFNATNNVVGTNANTKATSPLHHNQYRHHHHHQHQQEQPQLATPLNQQQKSYISPYVQQQKRDSAKGLHGFNDFDILSQQYNQHLQSPHIGYPYGSPPSPIANTSDFVFDTLLTAKPLIQPRYANINNFATASSLVTTTNKPPYNAYQKVITTIDYYGQAAAKHSTSVTQDYMGKSSRFEDDFCCRRNDAFARQQLDATSSSSGRSGSCGSSGGGSGPFIFGLPPEQQGDLINRTNGRGFCESTDTVISSERDYERENYSASATHSGKSTLQQSTSDTSSSSQDSQQDSPSPSDVNGNSRKGAKFLLLRKSKSKKKTKNDRHSAVDLTKPAASTAVSTEKSQKPTIKCVLVGDGAVGKTNLILSYLENRFNPEHVPTASDIYNAGVMVNDSPVNLTICDTAGQDTLDPLRELCYPDSDVFLLCFSVAKPETFDAIKTKWAPKFAKSKAALILVGTQADLRTNLNMLSKLQTNGKKPISYADAWDLATTIGAKYIETSSATQDKVKEVFDTAIWDGMLPSTLPPTPTPFWKKMFCFA